MKLVIQRCQEASVSVNGKTVGAIEKGLMVLIGVGKEDTTEVVDKYLKKLLQLRIFEDENGKTNRSLMDIGGQLLLVSQFTLYANCRHGNRPSFTDAGDPQRAEQLYEYMIEKAKEQVPVVETGIFGADMKVSLINDGPFTILLDEDELEKVKNRYESEQIFNNLNYLNVATNLAYFELTGKAEDINNEVNKYRSVTAGQIKEAAQKTFVRENCSTLYYKSNLPT